MIAPAAAATGRARMSGPDSTRCPIPPLICLPFALPTWLNLPLPAGRWRRRTGCQCQRRGGPPPRQASLRIVKNASGMSHQGAQRPWPSGQAAVTANSTTATANQRRPGPAGAAGHLAGRGPGRGQRSGGPAGRQIGHQLVQVTLGPRADRLAHSLVELVLGQPPGLEVLTELGGDPVPVGVRNPQPGRIGLAGIAVHLAPRTSPSGGVGPGPLTHLLMVSAAGRRAAGRG